jgi:phosphate transport system substrate-binding protein
VIVRDTTSKTRIADRPNQQFAVRAIMLFALCALCACSGRVGPRGRGEGRAATIGVRGSDTMLALVERWAERYMDENPGVSVEVSGGGSGTGIAALVHGTVDVACASRPLAVSERAALRARRGADARETPVALDAVAVYVHAQNPVRALDLTQLARIYRGEHRRWSELGGADLPIVLYGRENSSGTYAFFKERVLGRLDFALETQSLPGTAAVLHAVGRDPKGIGYAGLGHGPGVAPIALRARAGEESVSPERHAGGEARYPLSRPLLLITTASARPEVAAFVAWVRSPEGQRLVRTLGFHPLDEGSASEARAR